MRLTASLALAILVAATGASRAEVSAEPTATEVRVVVLGIIEGPDPIPQGIWEPVRDVDPVLFLNPEGDGRGDGRPSVAMDPVTKWPHVVWAYNNGVDHDIAYSRWDGDGWLETKFLTSSAADEIDPRIHVDGDATYVVWWEKDARAIRFVKRPRLGAWGVSEQVNEQPEMRPSVATWGGTVRVAAETEGGHGGKNIILSTRHGPSDFDAEIVAANPDDLALDVVLHVERDVLWMDWTRSGTEFAYSEFAGDAWTPVATLPWTDHSWTALEEARLRVRSLVLSSP
jgi:hypothetical protein